MRVCRERSVFGLKRAENDLATVAGLAVNHYDGDAQRMRASIGQNDFMCKQCQQAKMVARTDFWDGPTVCFLPASHELLLSAFGPNGHGSMWRGMDDAVAVVAGLAADVFNRIPGRAHTRNERIGLLGRVLALWFRLSNLHGVIVAGVATGEAGSNLLLVGGECGVPVWVSALEA